MSKNKSKGYKGNSQYRDEWEDDRQQDRGKMKKEAIRQARQLAERNREIAISNSMLED